MIEVECIGGSIDGAKVPIELSSQWIRIHKGSFSKGTDPVEIGPDQTGEEYEEYLLIRNPRNPSERILLAKYLYEKLMGGGLTHAE